MLKKFLLTIPLLALSLFFISSNQVDAAYDGGSSGTICQVRVWKDSYNYYQPGSTNVNFYLQKPSSTCNGDRIYYYVFTEKYVSGRWQYHSRVDGQNGWFTTQSPTKQININTYLGSSGTYRINARLYANDSFDLGSVYSNSFTVTYNSR